MVTFKRDLETRLTLFGVMTIEKAVLSINSSGALFLSPCRFQ